MPTLYLCTYNSVGISVSIHLLYQETSIIKMTTNPPDRATKLSGPTETAPFGRWTYTPSGSHPSYAPSYAPYGEPWPATFAPPTTTHFPDPDNASTDTKSYYAQPLSRRSPCGSKIQNSDPKRACPSDETTAYGESGRHVQFVGQEEQVFYLVKRCTTSVYAGYPNKRPKRQSQQRYEYISTVHADSGYAQIRYGGSAWRKPDGVISRRQGTLSLPASFARG